MSHRHHCCVTGHDFECGENCDCSCGLPMEGNDHSDCPVELRACAEHAGQDRLTAEVSPDAEELTSAFCPQSASSRAPTVNVVAQMPIPAQLSAGACGVATAMLSTARKSKTATSPFTVLEHPTN